MTALPFQVGDRVAFREDHEKWPGMYGTVTHIDEDNGFGLEVYDPSVGPTGVVGDHRATIGDVQ